MRWPNQLRPHIQGRIWSPAAVALLSGQLLGLTVALDCLIVSIACLALLPLILQRQRGPSVAATWLLLLLAMAGLSSWTVAATPKPVLDLPFPRLQPPVQVLAVRTEPAWAPHGFRMEAQWLQSCYAPGDCKLRDGRLDVQVHSSEVPLHVGDLLRVPAFTLPPPAYGNPGARDLRGPWQARGLVGQIRVAHVDQLAIFPSDRPWWQWPGQLTDAVVRCTGTWQRSLAQRLRKVVPGPDGDVLAALALGDRASVEPHLQDWLKATGTSHVMAVSGSHLAAVVWLVRWVLQRLLRGPLRGLLRRRPLDFWLFAPCSTAAWTYALVTGSAQATVRAGWMVSVVLLSRAVAARLDIFESLGLGLTCLLILDPIAMGDAGLQLSILGVLGLVWAGGLGGENRGLIGWLRMAWRSSLAPSALTAPVVLAQFGALPLVSVPANLLVVPYAGTLLLPFALALTGLACALPAEWTGWLAPLARGALWPLHRAVALPSELTPLWHAHGWPVVTVGLLPPVLVAAWWHRRRWLWAAGVLTLIAAISLEVQSVNEQVAPGDVQLTFLDVGHGDCTLLRFGDGSTLLVDAGGFVGDDGLVGRLAVVPALHALGVKRIDRMVISHGHPDHENGLLAVARNFDVGELWWNRQVPGGQEHAQLLAILSQHHVPIRDFSTGPRHIQLAGVDIDVLWPPEAQSPHDTSLDFNDNSLVLQVQAHGQKLLLAGDIEQTAETRLLQSGVLGAVTLIKVPHHGSRTSSTPEFLGQLQPKIALAGARPWGPLPFPHAEIRARYQVLGVPLWTSDAGYVRGTVGTTGMTLTQGERTALLEAPRDAAKEASR